MQITALLFLPDFPGWLAPLHFNPGIMLPLPMMYAQKCAVWRCSSGVYERAPEDSEDSTGGVSCVAVRFEELAIFILTLSVSWVSACGLVGGYRSHATRGESSPAPAALHGADCAPPVLPSYLHVFPVA